MLALSVSYFGAGYVSTLFLFWFYLYPVSAKGFSVLEGGWFASVPFLARAFATPFGGMLADRWSGAWGAMVGVRRVVMLANLICAASVIAGSYATSPYVGLGFFSLSLAAIGSCSIFALAGAAAWYLMRGPSGDIPQAVDEKPGPVRDGAYLCRPNTRHPQIE